MEKKFKFAYPGSFDPWTKGHLSVLLSILEHDPDANVDIIIAKNQQKSGMFQFEERKFIIEKSIPTRFQDRVRVSIVSGVVADYLYENNIPYFIKGVRDEADYRYETNLATLNSQFYGSPMTLLIPQVNFDLSNVSSSNLKMLANLGISLDRYANAFVREILKMKTSKKWLIGVTGGITVGKSTFCHKLQEYAESHDVKIHYINMDHLNYIILNDKDYVLPVYRKIREQIGDEFGKAVLNDDGTINRRELGHIVFSDQGKLDRLTNILLEPMLYLMGQKMNSLSAGIILVESAMLFDRHLTELVDENVIYIYVEPAMQKQRLLETRQNYSLEQAQKRIDSQMSFPKIKETIAEIHNDQYDRLFLLYSGEMPLDEDIIANIYQNLEANYFFRQEVRRNSQIFIPQELTFQNDSQFLEDISKIYHSPERSYHNATHINELLIHYLKVKHLLKNPAEVYLAIIFHDIRHDPKIPSNEDTSAQLAKEYLKKNLTSSNINIDIVLHLIQLTAHHDQELYDLNYDEQLFLDMDMSILAVHRERLLEYERQIYQEYSIIFTDLQYRKGRIAFLKKLLEKNTIYHSIYFKSRYESIARENIQYLCEFVQQNSIYKENRDFL